MVWFFLAWQEVIKQKKKSSGSCDVCVTFWVAQMFIVFMAAELMNSFRLSVISYWVSELLTH